jgi:hypothetical protein
MGHRLFLSFVCLGAGLVAEPAASGIDFHREVLPILSEHCFNCHGPDEKTLKGGLRLDQREGGLRGGDSGLAAIVPGKAGLSELVARITARDGGDLMPPPGFNKPLSGEQVGTLQAWIEAGAAYETHWAFVAPRRPAVPGGAVSGSGPFVARSPIDLFVLERMRGEGLEPSREAAPGTLLRRVWLDLAGLPPSPEVLDGFVAAYYRRGEAAYVEEVDRLLGTPAYAEKWARWWLDAARSADSDGYEKDLPREQWTWRDWVIGAFKRDLPYDRFIIEQLAGDLLPGAGQ